MNDYLKVRQGRLGPLFCHVSGKLSTSYQFSSVLNKTLKAKGLEGGNYKSHSFRIGTATTCTFAKQGVSDADIHAVGRWSSKAYQTYIRTSPVAVPLVIIRN
jgi:hypothetical protein